MTDIRDEVFRRLNIADPAVQEALSPFLLEWSREGLGVDEAVDRVKELMKTSWEEGGL